MSTNANLADPTANAAANTIAALMNLGTINIYSGTQPVNANTALSGNTLLATLTFGNPAFGAASMGVVTANAIAFGNAVATGVATFARIVKNDGTTVVMDITVGTSGAGLNLATTAIVVGGAGVLHRLLIQRDGGMSLARVSIDREAVHNGSSYAVAFATGYARSLMDQELRTRLDKIDTAFEKGTHRFDHLDERMDKIATANEAQAATILILERARVRHERALFGMQDEETLEWIPGLLQNTADFVKVKKWLIWLGVTIAGASVLNVLHNYGVADSFITAISNVFGGSIHVR